MKPYYFILGLILLFSCKKTEVIEPESSVTYLSYPQGYGHSGDSITSTIGFGYDAAGICDTLSVKSKVLKLNNQGLLVWGKVNYAGPGDWISGNSYADLVWNMKRYPNRVDASSKSFLSHMNSLLELASITDSSEYGIARAFGYYSYFLIDKVFFYYLDEMDFESELTEEFKNDVDALTPEAIVKKYGTHVIVGAAIGAKLEILYTCEIRTNSINASDVSDLLNKRANEYFGFLPRMITNEEIDTHLQSKEQLVFNTIGFQHKLFGVIDVTNNNSNAIRVDLNEALSSGTTYQFVKTGKDGLIPLYDFVSDGNKKQLLKALIDETYIGKQIAN